MNNFQPRTYAVKELALMYFPLSSPRSASVQFKRWIKYNKLLSLELTEAGYKNMQRLFTPLQVMLIVRHLGEP